MLFEILYRNCSQICLKDFISIIQQRKLSFSKTFYIEFFENVLKISSRILYNFVSVFYKRLLAIFFYFLYFFDFFRNSFILLMFLIFFIFFKNFSFKFFTFIWKFFLEKFLNTFFEIVFDIFRQFLLKFFFLKMFQISDQICLAHLLNLFSFLRIIFWRFFIFIEIFFR